MSGSIDHSIPLSHIVTRQAPPPLPTSWRAPSHRISRSRRAAPKLRAVRKSAHCTAPKSAAERSRKLPEHPGLYLADVMLSRWRTYHEQLEDCQRAFSECSVHELRVASRRLIAQYVLFECLIPGSNAEKSRRLLKRHLKALGPLRDTHVMRKFVEGELKRFPELLVLRNELRRAEKRLDAGLAEKIKDCKTRKLENWTLGLCRELASSAGPGPSRQQLISSIYRSAGQAFAEVTRRLRAVDPANLKTVHATRIAFKKFRYMVETLSPAFTGMDEAQLRKLTDYQRRMGDLQDLEIIQELLESFTAKYPGSKSLLRNFARHIARRRAQALQIFLTSASQLLDFWPPDDFREVAGLGDFSQAA